MLSVPYTGLSLVALAELFSTASTTAPVSKPLDSELDLHGMTHPGKLRTENQDHFLLCTVHPQVVVHGTSLPDPEKLPLSGQRLATLLLVADGVGGAVAGGDASRLATESIMRYVASSLTCYHTAGSAHEDEFLSALREAALEAHSTVRRDAVARHEGQTSATTLTIGIAVWPWLFVLQVGDSRCYHFSNGQLHQVSRDQTVAQDLVDQGLLTQSRAQASPFGHVLSSALGADEATPVVSRVALSRDAREAVLVCSDGLTKHVTDAEIGEHLSRFAGAEEACRALVDLALERGGSDNITVVIGRRRQSR